MIDKVLATVSVIFLFINNVSLAPTNHSVEDSISEKGPSIKRNNTENSKTDLTSESIISQHISKYNNTNEQIDLNNQQAFKDKDQLLATPLNSKNTLKTRKNKNDLFFCCPSDNVEPTTIPPRRNKFREKNTKPPVLKREKNIESEELPSFERKPALLLRFFPDGTAVLISKFQLHLHVKPKEIKFEPSDDSKEQDLDFNPGLILNDGRSYEVTYKRLEAIPTSKEQSLFDLDESGEKDSYRAGIDHRDHEFITEVSTSGFDLTSVDNKPYPLQETTSQRSSTEPGDSLVKKLSVIEKSEIQKTDKSLSTVGDSPFFVMTPEEMSSLQQQYEPAVASPLKATTMPTFDNQVKNNTLISSGVTQIPSTTTSMPNIVLTTEPSGVSSESSTTTTKCLSFRNQLTLALSTEDNIDNSLLKRHIFPTQDCNNSESDVSNTLSNLKVSDSTTTKSTPSTLPIITRPSQESTTTLSYSRNNLVPYLASQFSKHPSKSDVVVVTSLPVLIDLKSARNQPVTDVPAWREVTVGVVRDQQGQPVMPRYNNWAAHLRGLRKQTEKKFWNEFTTQKPDFRHQSRQPLQQGFQQSPSQINSAFWTDLQRQHQTSDLSRKQNINTELYRANITPNSQARNTNGFHVWRNRGREGDNRWNANHQSDGYDFMRTNEPYRNRQQFNNNREDRQNPSRNQGNSQQNNRRW